MNNGYILFYDSGIGGLTTLKKTLKLLPKERFLYFADNKNCPYGNKSQEEIEKLVLNNLKWLLKEYKIKMVVFACNTITACCAEHLRVCYGLDIVGTEPAVLPAIRASKTKEVLVIATDATLKQEKYKKLVNGCGGRVYSYCQKTLAEDIEQSAMLGKSIDVSYYVGNIKAVLKSHPYIDGLVLGCTHYCLYKDIFSRLLNINVYDGNDGVAKRVQTLLLRLDKASSVDFKGLITFVLSESDDKTAKQYKKIFKYIAY